MNVNLAQLAVVTASIQQLEAIGINHNITNKEVEVLDIDKYVGMYPPCSRILVDSEFEFLETKIEYIFPTRWLTFI